MRSLFTSIFQIVDLAVPSDQVIVRSIELAASLSHKSNKIFGALKAELYKEVYAKLTTQFVGDKSAVLPKL